MIAPFRWTIGIAAIATLRYLDKHGIDTRPILAMAELSRRQLSENSGRISAVSQYRFLELAAVAANDSLLGLHVAAGMDLRAGGILVYLTQAAETVGGALDLLGRYSAITNDAELIVISSGQDGETVLQLHTTAGVAVPRQQVAEFLLAGFTRALRLATNRNFSPDGVTFRHTRVSALEEFHRFFGCPVHFAQSADSCVLPQPVIELPIISADPYLLHILEAHAGDLLAHRTAAPGLRGHVESLLCGMLPKGGVKTSEVARRVGMSPRTFSRNLALEGTTYSAVRDRVRHLLALRYLEDPNISLQQIAWLLGYSEIAAFHHAFKRWTGTTPTRARADRNSA